MGRADRRHTPQRQVFAGLAVSAHCRRLAGVVAQLDDDPREPRAVVLAAEGIRLAEEIPGLFAGLAHSPGISLASLAALRERLAAAEAEMVERLLAQADVTAQRVVAVGVQDPGLWTVAQPTVAANACLGLCDAARLAECSGLTVIEAFAQRDLAQGGQGGPLWPVPCWLLLKDPRRTRVLLDLGQTTRIGYLPAAKTLHARDRILAFDAGPGMRMLDLLAQRLTAGQQEFDPGGRLAVQGRRIPELLDHWLHDPYFERPLPRWHPRGVRTERFLGDGLRLAVEAGWSVRDLLCTTTHLVAEIVWTAIRRRLPDDPSIDQVVVTGGGQYNGMLLREIEARCPNVPLVRLQELWPAGEHLEAAVSAVLAWMHVHGVPGNSPAVTGASGRGVLGRVTPGGDPGAMRDLHFVRDIAATESKGKVNEGG